MPRSKTAGVGRVNVFVFYTKARINIHFICKFFFIRNCFMLMFKIWKHGVVRNALKRFGQFRVSYF